MLIEVQRFKGSRVQEFKSSVVQGFKGSEKMLADYTVKRYNVRRGNNDTTARFPRRAPAA
jgi:hypothetical protein